MIVSSRKGTGTSRHRQKPLTPCKTNTNVKYATIHLLEIDIRGTICDLGEDILCLTHKAQPINRKIDKRNFIKILKVWLC